MKPTHPFQVILKSILTFRKTCINSDMFFSIFPSLWLQALSSWSRVKLTDTLLELLPEIWIETEKLSRAWAVSFCWCLPKALSGSTDKQNEQNAPVKSRKITLMGLHTLGKLTTIKKKNFTEFEVVQNRIALNPFFFKGSFWYANLQKDF